MLIKVSSMYFWNPPDDMENPHQTEIDGYETFFLRKESLREMLDRSGFVDCGVGCWDIWMHLAVDSNDVTHFLHLRGWETELDYIQHYNQFEDPHHHQLEYVNLYRDSDLLDLCKVTPAMILELIEDTMRAVDLIKLRGEAGKRHG